MESGSRLKSFDYQDQDQFPSDNERSRHGSRHIVTAKRGNTKLESLKPEMIYNPEKEPFKTLPSKQKGAHLPKRLFLPKSSTKDIFTFLGLMAPEYCLPEAPESKFSLCPKFTKQGPFTRPANCESSKHEFPECRDRNMPSLPDKKGNPIEDHYIMLLFSKAAEEEAVSWIRSREDKIHKKMKEIENSSETKVIFDLKQRSKVKATVDQKETGKENVQHTSSNNLQVQVLTNLVTLAPTKKHLQRAEVPFSAGIIKASKPTNKRPVFESNSHHKSFIDKEHSRMSAQANKYADRVSSARQSSVTSC